MIPLVSNLRLAATLTAVSCSRVFTAHTLRHWNVPGLIENAELVVSELVTNAVKATGVLSTEPTYAELEDLKLLHLCIIGDRDSIYFQVWDTSVEPPVSPQAGRDDWEEGGRGLVIVNALSRRVGHFFPQGGGKVVWAELGLIGVTQRLPRREPKPPLNVVLPESDPALLVKHLGGQQAL